MSVLRLMPRRRSEMEITPQGFYGEDALWEPCRRTRTAGWAQGKAKALQGFSPNVARPDPSGNSAARVTDPNLRWEFQAVAPTWRSDTDCVPPMRGRCHLPSISRRGGPSWHEAGLGRVHLWAVTSWNVQQLGDGCTSLIGAGEGKHLLHRLHSNGIYCDLQHFTAELSVLVPRSGADRSSRWRGPDSGEDQTHETAFFLSLSFAFFPFPNLIQNFYPLHVFSIFHILIFLRLVRPKHP